MLKNFFLLTLKSVRHRPVRSWLTIIGIVIGVMLVVTILSLGSGVKNIVGQTLQRFGSDLIIVFPGKDTNPVAGFASRLRFRVSDLEALEQINGVKFVVPMDVASLATEYKGDKKSVMIHAAPWKRMSAVLESSQGVRLAHGRWPTNDDNNEIVVGYKTAHSLYKKRVDVGDDILLKSKRMKVVGVVSEIGVQMDDNLIYVSMKVFHQLSGSKSGATTALVKVVPGSNVEVVSRQIRHQLEKQQTVTDFSILTPAKASQIVGDVLSTIEIALMFIGLVSLLVGAVGIMNTMYTSVLERTRQIGVMKAVGATRDEILSLFIIESGMIGLIGGIFGVLFGIITAFLAGLAAAQFGIRGLFSFWSLDFVGFLVVLIVAFLTGLVSGILPAKQAADMEPAEALRYE